MTQKRILIASDAEDLHAAAVTYALRKKGHCCERLYTPDFPTLLALSNRIAPDGAGQFLMRGPGIGEVDQSARFDAVWLRRHRDAVLPEEMHPGDREVASRQCEAFLAGVVAFLDQGSAPEGGPGTFWVNPLTSDGTARQKAYQLRSAVRAGLEIPETLISNDPVEIRAFLRAHGGVVAHKLLEPASWLSADGEQLFAAYTAPLRAEQLPDDAMVRLCPGIFQPFLAKQFEIRVACLGDFLVAIRIDSQADDRAATDWRAGQIHVEMTPHELPPEVATGCRRLLLDLGLNYGSLDFVVGPDGKHTFLEVNPQGQFLFLETRADLPLLDMFSEFLVAGIRGFTWQADHEIVHFREFAQHWQETAPAFTDEHIQWRKPMGVPDHS